MLRKTFLRARIVADALVVLGTGLLAAGQTPAYNLTVLPTMPGATRSWAYAIKSVLACIVAFAVLPVCAADLRFAGATRFQVTGASVALTVERINNNTTGGISGTVRIELWANPAPTVIGTTQVGYRTAILTLAQLAGGASTTGISSSVAYTAPPAGPRWYYTLYITEFTGTTTSNEGYVGRDFVNFPGAPAVQTQPQPVTVSAGDPVTLSVTAVGVPAPTYQWAKDGTSVSGATGATLRLPAALSSQAGIYRVTVTNSEGSVQSNAATVAVNTVIVKHAARLGNLSVRSIAGTGDQTLTVGFVVGGSGGSKQLLVRGIGPTLASFNLTGFLTDPRLSLYNGQGALINQNDDWGGGATLANAFSAVGAFPLPATSRDAALFGAIAAGGNSVQVGSGSGTGIALVEAYDADAMTSPARLINLSARNQVGLDSNALFVGFVIAGTGAKTVLIRGIGPALAQFGVGGVLADPRLTVYDSQSRGLLSNDDWSPPLASTFAAVGAFALPNGSKDAALVTTLVPGAYSAELVGVNRTTGVGLVEVYEVPDTTSSSVNVGTAGGGSGTVTIGSSGPIAPGSEVTLTANPALGSTFVGWTGSVTATTPTVTVPVDARLNAAAVYGRGPFTLTPSTSGTGSGAVTWSPFGSSFEDGTLVTVTAVPAAGSTFTGWSGDVTGTATSQTLTMDSNKAATATFTRNGPLTPGSFTLTLGTAGTGSGTVTTSPSVSSFAAGTVVTVTAVPAAGSTFAGWSGNVTGTATSQTVTMDANKVATATFTRSGPLTPGSFTLTLSTTGTGSGTVAMSPSGSSFAAGTVVTVTAVPAAGSTFAGWSGDITGTATSQTVTMNANKTATANFTRSGSPSTFTLTVSTTGTGSGTVTTSPPGTSFPPGTVVTVTAVPAAGSTFAGWIGDVTGTATSQTVTMNANRTATAIFILSGPPGGGGIPTTRSIYEGTYRGQFNLRYSVTPIANPSQRRITAKSFDLTIELKTNFTFAGTANLQVTRVSANDPWFGALFGQSPNFGLMVLDEPPKNTSSLGSGLLIVFQNGVRLETTTEAGEVHVSTDGTLISSPPTTGTEMKWLAVKGEYKVENSFLGTVPEFTNADVIVAPVGATWALTRSGL